MHYICNVFAVVIMDIDESTRRYIEMLGMVDKLDDRPSSRAELLLKMKATPAQKAFNELSSFRSGTHVELEGFITQADNYKHIHEHLQGTMVQGEMHSPYDMDIDDSYVVYYISPDPENFSKSVALVVRNQRDIGLLQSAIYTRAEGILYQNNGYQIMIADSIDPVDPVDRIEPTLDLGGMRRIFQTVFNMGKFQTEMLILTLIGSPKMDKPVGGTTDCFNIAGGTTQLRTDVGSRIMDIFPPQFRTSKSKISSETPWGNATIRQGSTISSFGSPMKDSKKLTKFLSNGVAIDNRTLHETSLILPRHVANLSPSVIKSVDAFSTINAKNISVDGTWDEVEKRELLWTFLGSRNFIRNYNIIPEKFFNEYNKQYMAERDQLDESVCGTSKIQLQRIGDIDDEVRAILLRRLSLNGLDKARSIFKYSLALDRTKQKTTHAETNDRISIDMAFKSIRNFIAECSDEEKSNFVRKNRELAGLMELEKVTTEERLSRRAILDISSTSESGQFARVQAINEVMMKAKMSEKRAMEFFEKLKKDGDIFSPRNGIYKITHMDRFTSRM